MTEPFTTSTERPLTLRVIVCGGRTYTDADTVARVLDGLHWTRGGIALLAAGDAKGADALALAWASWRGVSLQRFRADWDNLGRAAGPIRNQHMLDEVGPDLVVAFPGGRGTADMVRRARAAGVCVVEVGP